MRTSAMATLRSLFSAIGIWLLSTAASLSILPRDLDQALLPSYEFVIVGGGVSGLTVANRLTENPLINVLVIEAGIE